MDIVTAFLIPALVGVVVGIFSGMLGIGGGTILVPVFRLLFGMSPMMSTATSLFAIIPTSLSGAITHIRNKTCYISYGVALGLGGACTSAIGVWLATLSPDWAVMAGTAIVICYSAANMLIKAIRYKPNDESHVATSASAGDQGKESVRKATPKELALAFFIGVVAGLVSGYVGVGGGFLMVPMMLSLLNISMRYASGTSLIAVVLLAIPGVIGQGLLGNINYLAGIAIAIGSIPGAIIGARLVKRIPEKVLRFVFGGFLLFAGIMLVVNEFIA